MVYTHRYALGILLILACIGANQAASRWVRQSDDEKSISGSTISSDSSTTFASKPKTDSTNQGKKYNKETHKPAQKENLKPEEDDSTSTSRSENARSLDIDIDKYVSADFHNKNNVYNLPTSPENKKYIPSETYDAFTTESSYKFTKFTTNFLGDLTTPSSNYFDAKHKLLEKEIEQSLKSDEYITENDDDTNTKEPVTSLDYLQYRHITVNSTKENHHKTDIIEKEEGVKKVITSTYNNTKIISDEVKPKEYSSTTKSVPSKKFTDVTHEESEIRTTLVPEISNQIKKADFKPETKFNGTTIRPEKVHLTKPPKANDTYNSVLNNKIENETVKPTDINNSVSSTTSAIPQTKTSKAAISTTTRGTIKYADTIAASTVKIPEITEQAFQENQVVPVKILPPTTTIKNNDVVSTTEEISSNNNTHIKLNSTTHNENSTEQYNSSTTTTTVEITTNHKLLVDSAITEENLKSADLDTTTLGESTSTSSDKPEESSTEPLHMSNYKAVPDTTILNNEVLTTVTDSALDASTALNSNANSTTDDLTTTERILSSTSEQETTLYSTTNDTQDGTTVILESSTEITTNIENDNNSTIEYNTSTTTEYITDATTDFIPTIATDTNRGLNISTTDNTSTIVSINATTESIKDNVILHTSTVPDDNTTNTVIDNTSASNVSSSTEIVLTEKSVPSIASNVTESISNSDNTTTNKPSTNNSTSNSTTIHDNVSSTFDAYESSTKEVLSSTSKPVISYKAATEMATGSTNAKKSDFDKKDAVSDGIYSSTTQGYASQGTKLPDYVSDGTARSIVDFVTSTMVPQGVNEPDSSTVDNLEQPSIEDDDEGSGTLIAIIISAVGAVCLVLLVVLLIVMRKRQKRFNYPQMCKPVDLDSYNLDNVSVYNSVRRKGAMRASKRSYGNLAFEDPNTVSNPLNFQALSKFSKAEDIKAEYESIPQVTARMNELPDGCEVKNRYANVIPLPETRVFLAEIKDCPNSDYINANYVTGVKSTKGHYIACQAPMSNTVDDFWRMVWEQQSKVILMLTHLYENGMEKCSDYLPPSEVVDCHRLFGDYQVTLKKRDVKDKYIISSLQLKNMVSNSWREVTHLWYMGWPEKGVPTEVNSLIAFLIEARSFIKSNTSSQGDSQSSNGITAQNGDKQNSPIVVHCSPGTGRTGTVIACDIAIREFEMTRQVDIPKTVYRIRRDRASSVQTQDQYAFIYKVITLYATKLTGGALDSL